MHSMSRTEAIKEGPNEMRSQRGRHPTPNRTLNKSKRKLNKTPKNNIQRANSIRYRANQHGMRQDSLMMKKAISPIFTLAETW